MKNLIILVSYQAEHREMFRKLNLSQALPSQMGVFITDKFPTPSTRVKGILVVCADDPALETYFIMLNIYQGYEDIEVIIVGRTEKRYLMVGKTTHHLDTSLATLTTDVLASAITVLLP